VRVLNINELANSLKPVVLPGEVMKVFVLKEGKEAGQGVGYLDDGTMVVVDQGKRALGKTIEVTVTSVLQTTAGKMIFCRWPEAQPGEDTGRGLRTGRGNGREHRPREGEQSGRFTNGERVIAPIPPLAMPQGAEEPGRPVELVRDGASVLEEPVAEKAAPVPKAE
jgi:hypothetical protein